MATPSILKKNVKLHFDNDKRYYIAGDTVSGTVTMDVEDPIKVAGIFVKVKGAGLVHWNEVVGQKNDGKNKTKNIQEKENFLREIITLWIPGDAAAEKEGSKKIAAGAHNYTWNLKLPLSLPSSYKCSNGYVKYHVKVTVDRPWALDWTDEHEIHVISYCDLDTIPSSMDPIALEKHVEVGGTFRSKRPITVNVRLPNQGLAINHKIPINVNIKNISPKDVVNSTLKIKQECVMTIGSFQKTHKREEVFKVKHGKVESGHTGTWDDVNAILPSLPSSGGSWKNMQFSYVAEFSLQTARSGPRLQIEFPIVIGTHRRSSSSPATSMRPPSPTLSMYRQSSTYPALNYGQSVDGYDTTSLSQNFQDCHLNPSGYSHQHPPPRSPSLSQSLPHKVPLSDTPTAPEPSAPPPDGDLGPDNVEPAYNPHYSQSIHNTTWPPGGTPNYAQGGHNTSWPGPEYPPAPPPYTPYATPYSPQNAPPGQFSSPYPMNSPNTNIFPGPFDSAYPTNPSSQSTTTPGQFIPPYPMNSPSTNTSQPASSYPPNPPYTST